MKKIMIFLFLGLMVFPLVSADTITPGYSHIKINNVITNINDYPDYVFIVMIDGKASDFLINGELNIVRGDGIIKTPYYKFESVSVYALEKSKFDEKIMSNMSLKEATDYLDANAIKVISNIEHYKEKHISNPNRIENNFYTIDLNQTIGEPTNTKIQRNYLVYFYILIPLICLIIIISILIKRGYKK